MTTETDPHTPTRNVGLLQRVMDHIDAHPEQHNQDCWIDLDTVAFGSDGRAVVHCGTAACFAGWAALLTYGTICLTPVGWFRFPDAPDLPFSSVAGKLLGLTDAEAGLLFEAVNTRDMLRLMVADLVAGHQLADQEHYMILAENTAVLS